MQERLLQEVVSTRARYALLDLTAIESVDTNSASYLVRMVRAVELIGARAIITGIHPLVAQAMVSLGIDLSRILTLRNLQEGLRWCLREMGTRVSQVAATPGAKPPAAKTADDELGALDDAQGRDGGPQRFEIGGGQRFYRVGRRRHANAGERALTALWRQQQSDRMCCTWEIGSSTLGQSSSKRRLRWKRRTAIFTSTASGWLMPFERTPKSPVWRIGRSTDWSRESLKSWSIVRRWL